MFYYACSYAKVDYSRFMNVTAFMAWKLIPEPLESQPIFLCIPVRYDRKVVYQSVPLGYRMWQKKEYKLELTASMICRVMPEFRAKNNVIILCDSWYAKNDLARVVNEYSNLDIICNARCDSVIYDLAPEPSGRRGRPAKHGHRLSIWDDFVLSDEKIGDYYTGVRRVLTNIFGAREVLAYVTSTDRDNGSRRLFFSAVFPEQPHVFRAWQEKAPLNQTGSGWMRYIPLFLYAFRWNIEVSYCERK